MLRDHSAVRIISWEELLMMLKALAESFPRGQPIRPVSKSALVPAAIIAELTGLDVDFNKGTTFDITDKETPVVAIFQIDREETHLYGKTEIFNDILYKDQKLILPWTKY